MNPRARKLVRLIARAIVDDFYAGRSPAEATTEKSLTQRTKRPKEEGYVDTHAQDRGNAKHWR